MLKNNILALGNVRKDHLLRNGAAVIRRKSCAVALNARNTPVAKAAVRVVYIRHNLTRRAVVLAAAAVVKLAFDACKQTADCFAVLTGNLALLLPEIPVAVAFKVFNVQKFVCRNSYKIGFYSVL